MSLTDEQECYCMTIQELWAARKRMIEELKVISRALKEKLDGDEGK